MFLVKVWRSLTPIEIPLLASLLGFFIALIFAGNALWCGPDQRQQRLQRRSSFGLDESPSSVDPSGLEDGSGSRRQNRRFSGRRKNDLSVSPLLDIQQNVPSGASDSESIEQKGSGDLARRGFYKLLFLALLSRFIFLPVQAIVLIDYSCDSNPVCTLARTFPEIAFTSAFSLVVFFYAQLAGMASVGGSWGLSLILTRKKMFDIGTGIVYGFYILFFIITCFFPRIFPFKLFQMLVWATLSVIYFLLLILLVYFGPVLIFLLRASLAKWSGLSIRLISMCILCTIIFLIRALSFATASFHGDVQYESGFLPSYLVHVETENDIQCFTRDILGYFFLELVPSFAILIMMNPRSSSAGRYMSRPTIPGASSYGGNSKVDFMRRNMSGSAPKGIGSRHYTFADTNETKPLLSPPDIPKQTVGSYME